MTTVDAILSRWPLEAMLARCGVAFPRKGKFHSPFRPDNHPSCEVYQQRIWDRTTGESYDSIQVFAEVNKISNADAIKRLAEELPGRAPKAEPVKKSLKLPPLRWDQGQSIKACDSRGLRHHAGDIAGIYLGTLGFAEVCGFPSWILFEAGRVAEGRRIDGKNFPAMGNLDARKSHTLGGSRKSWPLGINPPKVKIRHDCRVLIVEGSPDYLAACDILATIEREFLPVAMLGANTRIHADALPMFKGRVVTIAAHPGHAGLAAAKRWAVQLQSAAAAPRIKHLIGGDLNDLVRIHGAETVAREIL
jgi:hypothetical protein